MIADELRMLLLSLGLTELDFADLIDPPVPVAAVERWLAGSEPVPPHVARTVRALDTLYDGEISRRMSALAILSHGDLPRSIAVPVYRSADALARHAPQFAAVGLPGYGAWLRRLRMALDVEGIESRFVPFDDVDEMGTSHGRPDELPAILA